MGVTMSLYPLWPQSIDKREPVYIDNHLEVDKDYAFQQVIRDLKPRLLPPEARVEKCWNCGVPENIAGMLTAGEIVATGYKPEKNGTWPYTRAAMAYLAALPPDTVVLVEFC